MAIIAPFWATTDTYSAFRDGHSKVYYQVHKPGYSYSSAAILSMASEHVQRYTGKFKNFKASWVLVVTWEKLCPYVYYYYYDNNCRWVRLLCNIHALYLRSEKKKRHTHATFLWLNSSDLHVMASYMLLLLLLIDIDELINVGKT